MKCERCGKKGIALKLMKCEECDKLFCKDCFASKDGVEFCLDCRLRKIEEYKKEILTKKGEICPACGSKGSLEVVGLTVYRKQEQYFPNSYYGPIFRQYLVKCTHCSFPYDSEHMALLESAQRAEKVGGYQDAARIYEGLNLFDKARQMNELDRTGTVKQVSLNLNTLIDQLRQGGLVLPYKCPNCGGTIKIDKEYNQGMKLCAYCGSPIDTEVIASLLKNI